MQNNDVRLSYEQRMKLGVLLLLNVPKKMLFGIDLNQWIIGAKFMGIKLIPIGIHYILYSLENENYLNKKGIFIEFTQNKRIIILEFNKENDYFLPISSEMEKNYEIGVDNLDFEKYLGEYPLKKINDWHDISNFINKKILEKLQCNYNKENIKNNLEIIYEINYTDICMNQPKKINKLDKSDLLNKLIENKENNLLAEFQFCFINFIIGESYESLMQWKDIFILLTCSFDAIKLHENFFCDFLEIIYNQFRFFPDDLFEETIINNTMLKRYLTTFLLAKDNINLIKFTKRQNLFKNYIEEKFKYKLESEEERIINNFKLGIKYYNTNDDFNDDLPVVIDENELK